MLAPAEHVVSPEPDLCGTQPSSQSPSSQSPLLPAKQLPTIVTARVSPTPSELEEETYCHEVLQLDGNTTEFVLDEQFIQRAKALGISTSRPESPHGDHPTSATESTFTLASPANHARTCSTSSTNSASTALTTHSSTAISTAALRPSAVGTAASLTRRRSNSLSFSQYDKYLASIDTGIATQPKIQTPRPSAEPSHSIFKVKSYRILKQGIKLRLGWKKGVSRHTEPTMSDLLTSSPCCDCSLY